MVRATALLLVLGLAACTASPESSRPLSFHLDPQKDPPVLTLSSTPEQLQRLKARYVSFKVQLGLPVDNVQYSVQQRNDGSLDLPWAIPLRNFSSPFPVRVVGTLPDGKQDVVSEDTF